MADKSKTECPDCGSPTLCSCHEIDSEREDELDLGFTSEDCGRWVNGKLSPQCSLAGTEDCDWECPIGWRGDR